MSSVNWAQQYGFQKHTYVDKFKVTSVELSNTANLKEKRYILKINDLLDIESASNENGDKWLVVKKDDDLIGYVKKDQQDKIMGLVPCKLYVVKKTHMKDNSFSIRLDLDPVD